MARLEHRKPVLAGPCSPQTGSRRPAPQGRVRVRVREGIIQERRSVWTASLSVRMARLEHRKPVLAGPCSPPDRLPPASPSGAGASPSPGGYNKREAVRLDCLSFGADGETRTRTGKLPLPPQSSASTISPHPLSVWECKNRH